MSISTAKLTSVSLITCLIGFSNLIILELANAYSITFSNGDFQSSTSLDGSNGWTGVGSTEIDGPYTDDNVSFDGTNQGIITTGCTDSATSPTECLDNRNDDPVNVDPNIFNLRNQDQISASPEDATLQNNLNLSANALTIFREIDGVTFDGSNGQPALRRTAKEGSAIFQDITVNNDSSATDTKITFNWDFLTNDGAGSLGDKDFAFISISGNGFEQVIPLESSTGNIVGPDGDNYGASVPIGGLYNSSIFDQDFSLTPGSYRIGFGVIDVDGVGNSSALLIDEFVAQELPFEFTPTIGIGLVLGLFTLNKLRRRYY